MPHASRFTPPCCPHPGCDFHLDSTGWRFKKTGFYTRLARPHRIQRYRCASCRRAFSSQTFSPTYWLRRPELLEAVFHGEVSGSGHRQIARQYGVSHTTIQRLAERLGRHCLLVHEAFRRRARERLSSEPVVLDGLRSFAGGQYWPLELTGLIGARSYYSHDFTVTELRRSGAMANEQKKRRAGYERRLGRPDPRALFKDVVDLLESNLLAGSGAVELRTDEDETYRRALRAVQKPGIEHLTTSSKEPRTPRNPLFAINAHHGFLRHSGSNHKRETIAFSKRIQAVVYRHAVFQVWRNLVKPASLRDPRQTPAQRLGVTDKRWTIPELLAVRRLPTRRRLARRVEDAYWGRVRSRCVRGERRYEPALVG